MPRAVPGAGRQDRELPPRLHRAEERRGRSSAHASHGAEGKRDGRAGWFRVNAKPGAMSFSVWVGFRGERQRGAGRQQRGSEESHTADSVRKTKECNLFSKKIGHSIAERQRVNERQPQAAIVAAVPPPLLVPHS